MTIQDKDEFRQYLRQCTDQQVYGCLHKEKAADREGYVDLCEDELERRNLP